MADLNITQIKHPEYKDNISYWEDYRRVLEGGPAYRNKMLYKFGDRETTTTYDDRKKMTPIPAHGKTAMYEIRNAIFQRTLDIERLNGPDDYHSAVSGELGGVDLKGSTMNNFIGLNILLELIAIGKVGVFVDKPKLDDTVITPTNVHPYLYYYTAEQIRAWRIVDNQLVGLLLQDNKDVIDKSTGLVIDTIEIYRLLTLTNDGVTMVTYDKDSNIIEEDKIKVSRIPFVIFQLSTSLLADVASYQNALLQLSSADMYYAIKANVPVLTEQYHPGSPREMLRNARTSNASAEGQSADAAKSDVPARDMGTRVGRRYASGLERPEFIAPPADPLRVSIEKQEVLKREIRQLVNLNLTNVDPKRESAESKNFDERGRDESLSYIGQELEAGELAILEIWSLYQEYTVTPIIKYPEQYSLKTPQEKAAEIEKLFEEIEKVQVLTLKKKLLYKAVLLMLEPALSVEEKSDIKKEIDALTAISVNPQLIGEHLEAGILGNTLASTLAGYPPGEEEKAKEDHAERAARIIAAQTAAANSTADAARGVKDTDTDQKDSAETEKTISQTKVEGGNIVHKTRGVAKDAGN